MKACLFVRYPARAAVLSARLSIILIALSTVAIPAANAETGIYFLRRLHLLDAEHTTEGGDRSVVGFRVSPGGVVAGYSTRYPDVPPTPYASYGLSGWLADVHGRTIHIGFGGGVNNSGNAYTQFVDLNARGTALGYSVVEGDRVPWIARLDSGTTRLDHFMGGSPTVVDINNDDWLVGYVDNVDGRVALLAQASSTPIRIGLLDAAHTDGDGRQMSEPVAINDSRHVIGTSVRYTDSDVTGTTAWLRYPNGEYWLPAPNATYGRMEKLTNSGYFGVVALSADETSLQVAHVSGAMRPVGAGTHFERIAENGTAVVSVSEWYRGSPTMRVNWLNSEAHGTVSLGLPEYGGSLDSPGVDTVVALTESGVVAGTSESPGRGAGAWVADMTGSITRIGLYGPGYEWMNYGMPPVVHHSRADGATESGLVWGASARSYSDINGVRYGGGDTAWVYNVHTGSLQTFPFPVNDYDHTSSRIHLVLENGTVIGTYLDFVDEPYSGIERVFLWIPGEGLVLLDVRIDVSATAAGLPGGYGPIRYATEARALVGFASPSYEDPRTEGWITGSGMYAIQLGGEPPPPHERGELTYVGRLGFHDAAHTGPGGLQTSGVSKTTDTGYSLGTSRRFVGVDDVAPSPGREPQTVWVGTGEGETRPIGFYDALHTRDDGRWENTPVDINNGGVTIGTATRFAGHAYAGESAWVADRHGTTLKVGYYDAAHTGAGGVKISRVVDLNNANRLIGYSLHPDTEASSAWLATSTGAITRIGLLDAVHTAPDGTRVSLPVAINDDGFIIGVSEYRAPGVSTAGLTPWLRLPSGTARIVGLQTGVHKAANGLHHGTVEFLSPDATLAGHAVRYRSGSDERAGQTAWLAQATQPNRPVGFYTGLHAGAGNVAHGRIMGLNELGYAMGFSTQYPSGARSEDAGRGRTAWLASISHGTVRVGLYDAAHSSGPFQFNHVRGQNSGIGVIGTAQRFAAGSDHGLDGWYATIAGGTRRLALDDARHRRSDGYERHVPTILNDARLIGGISARYSGSMEVGQSAWIYDVSAQTYAVIELSVRPVDQFAWSVITDLRDDGSAFGLYRKFGADGSNQGDRAFMFLPGLGAFDLAAALDVAPGSRGWAFLGRPVGASSTGAIIGHGQRADPESPPFSQGVYLLQE